MTNDEILQAAKEAGLLHKDAQTASQIVFYFAAIIEKRTIERCASLAEQGPEQCEWTDEAYYDTGLWHGYLSAAAAIRKLGEQ